jgi:hypothetical protein
MMRIETKFSQGWVWGIFFWDQLCSCMILESLPITFYYTSVLSFECNVHMTRIETKFSNAWVSQNGNWFLNKSCYCPWYSILCSFCFPPISLMQFTKIIYLCGNLPSQQPYEIIGNNLFEKERSVSYWHWHIKIGVNYNATEGIILIKGQLIFTVRWQQIFFPVKAVTIFSLFRLSQDGNKIYFLLLSGS